MDIISLFFWAIYMTMAVAAIGTIADLRLIKKGRSDLLKPKWVFNLAEFGLIFGLIVLKWGMMLPWWHMAWLMFTMVPVWSILHDCWIGLGLTKDPWYLGQGKWDRKISATFNQFGTKHPGKIYFYFKLWWLGLLIGGFFAL